MRAGYLSVTTCGRSPSGKEARDGKPTKSGEFKERGTPVHATTFEDEDADDNAGDDNPEIGGVSDDY